MIVIAGTAVSIFVGLGSIYAYLHLPIHQVSVHCYDFQVQFKGPKSEKYIKILSQEIQRLDQPVRIKNDRVFTTVAGTTVDQVRKVIMYRVRPEWFSDTPSFKNPKDEKIVRTWSQSDESRNVSAKWCHVLEAAIAKNGIDIEARRKNPDIWPKEKFPR